MLHVQSEQSANLQFQHLRACLVRKESVRTEKQMHRTYEVDEVDLSFSIQCL